MCRAIEGRITCPLCGSDAATVHRQAKGKRVRYIRCYSEPGGASMRCGTLQCLGPTGQAFIDRHIKPITPDKPEREKSPIAPSAEKAPAREPIAPAAKPPSAARSGLLKWLNED